MDKYFCIADSFCLVVESDSCDSAYTYICNQYTDYVVAPDCTMPVMGHIKELDKSVSHSGIRELYKNLLYEGEDCLWVKHDSKYAKVKLDNNQFAIGYPVGFDGKFLFFIIGVLMRLYCHKYGIDFFHASSFIYEDKVYMLNSFPGAGKTEIMMQPLLKGATFISDDMLIVNEKGLIYPYTVTIPISWFSWGAVNDEFLKKVGVSHIIYDIINYCKRKHRFYHNRIQQKLSEKYIYDDYPYHRFTNAVTEMKYYRPDTCIWLQEADFSGFFDFSNEEFFQYMDLCLKGESRWHCDWEGFFLLKFPEISPFMRKRMELRMRICNLFKVVGFAVKNRNFSQAAKLILTNTK